MYLRTEKILKFWKDLFWKLIWIILSCALGIIGLFFFFSYENNIFFQLIFFVLSSLLFCFIISYSFYKQIKKDMKINPEDSVVLLRFFNFIIEFNKRNQVIFLGKKLTDLMKELKDYSFKYIRTGFKILFYFEITSRIILFIFFIWIMTLILHFPAWIIVVQLIIILILYLIWVAYSVLFMIHAKKVYLSPLENTNPHIIIGGVSGTGKSALLRAIVADIILKIKKPVLIIDFHNEFIKEVEKLGGKIYHMNEISINVFELTDSPKRHVSMLASMIHSIIPLGQIQQFTLENILYDLYKQRGILEEDPRTWNKQAFTSQDLMETLMQMLKKSPDKKTHNSLVGLYRRLDMLFGSNIFGSKTDIPFAHIIREPTVIALANVNNESTQKFLVEMILRRLYFYMLSSKKLRNEVKLFVVLDEAPKIIPNADSSIVNSIAAESRKYNIALILAGQSNNLLNRSIIQNSGTKIQFFSQEPSEFEFCTKLMSGAFDEHINSDRRRHITAEMLRSLNPLQFIFTNTVHKNPIMVKLKAPWKRKYLLKILNTIPEPKEKEKPQPQKENSIDELIDVKVKEENPNQVIIDTIMRKLQLSNGCLPKTRLLKSMNMSVRLFYDVITMMKEQKLIDEVELPITDKKSTKYIVRSVPNKSSMHFALIALISDHLFKKNYGFTIKDGPDVPDMEVDVAGQSIALEVEMGKKKDYKEIANMFSRRLKNYNKVIIISPAENIEKMNTLVNSQNIMVMTLENFFKFFK